MTREPAQKLGGEGVLGMGQDEDGGGEEVASDRSSHCATADRTGTEDGEDALFMELAYLGDEEHVGLELVGDELPPPDRLAAMVKLEHPGSLSPTSSSGGGTVMEHSCEACKRSKKRCSRRQPCAMCVSRGIECVPLGRGPGRPPGSKTRLTGSTSSSDLSIRSQAHSTTYPTLGVATRRSTRMAATPPPHMAGSPPPRDADSCGVYREAAEHCKMALAALVQGSRLDAEKCLTTRNLWARVSKMSGVDMTFGILPQLEKTLSSDIVKEESCSSTPSSQRRRKGAMSSPPSSDRGVGQQKQQKLDIPASSRDFTVQCLTEDMQKLDDGVSMVCAYMYANDELLFFVDDGFSSMFMSREELASKFKSTATIPALLLAPIFHAEDLADVYSTLTNFWFGEEALAERGGTRETEWLCRCVDRRGQTFVAWVRVRDFITSCADCYPAAAVLAIRPVPPNKFLGVDHLTSTGSYTEETALTVKSEAVGACHLDNAPAHQFPSPSTAMGTSPMTNTESPQACSPLQHPVLTSSLSAPGALSSVTPSTYQFRPLKRGLSELPEDMLEPSARGFSSMPSFDPNRMLVSSRAHSLGNVEGDGGLMTQLHLSLGLHTPGFMGGVAEQQQQFGPYEAAIGGAPSNAALMPPEFLDELLRPQQQDQHQQQEQHSLHHQHHHLQQQRYHQHEHHQHQQQQQQQQPTHTQHPHHTQQPHQHHNSFRYEPMVDAHHTYNNYQDHQHHQATLPPPPSSSAMYTDDTDTDRMSFDRMSAVASRQMAQTAHYIAPDGQYQTEAPYGRSYPPALPTRYEMDMHASSTMTEGNIHYAPLVESAWAGARQTYG